MIRHFLSLSIFSVIFFNLQCAYPPIRPVEQFKEYYAGEDAGKKIVVSRLFREHLNTGEKRHPVILCHTLRVNDSIWVLGKDNSLATYLADKGFDVWTFSFSGFGKSRQDHDGKDITFNRLVSKDLPAVIGLVKKETGHEKVHLIGHGFGADVCAVYAGFGAKDDVATLVAIAPVMINFYKSDIMLKIGTGRCPLVLPDNEAMRLCAGAVAVNIYYTPSDDIYFEKLFFNRDNVDKWRIFRLYSFAVDVTPEGLAEEYRMMVEKGQLRSEGKYYEKAIKNIAVPVMVMAGIADNFAPSESVRHFYRSLNAKQKDYIEFSRVNGFRNDYGHLDLVIGKNVEKEVYPNILRWIKKAAYK